jgi:hypothetical protein
MDLSIPRSGTNSESSSFRLWRFEPANLTEAFFGWIGTYAAFWLFAFWSLVLRARSRTGAWPIPARGPSQPKTIDPKVFPVHHLGVYVASLVLFFMVLLGIVLLLVSAFVPSQRPRRRVYVAIAMLTALLGTTVFSGFMLWFVD